MLHDDDPAIRASSSGRHQRRRHATEWMPDVWRRDGNGAAAHDAPIALDPVRQIQ